MLAPWIRFARRQTAAQDDDGGSVGLNARPPALVEHYDVERSTPPYRWVLTFILQATACLGPRLLTGQRAPLPYTPLAVLHLQAGAARKCGNGRLIEVTELWSPRQEKVPFKLYAEEGIYERLIEGQKNDPEGDLVTREV